MEETQEDIEVTKTIRIGLDTWRELNNQRGLNNCKTFEDVIKYLLGKVKNE